jgi:hypothetical protein
MGGKNSGRQKKPALPSGTFRLLDGSIVQGGRVEKRRVHGGASASSIPSDGAVEVADGSQDIQQDEVSGDKDDTEVEELQKGLKVNNVAVRSS